LATLKIAGDTPAAAGELPNRGIGSNHVKLDLVRADADAEDLDTRDYEEKPQEGLPLDVRVGSSAPSLDV